MSKGKIKKPRNPDLPDNLTKKPLEDVIYHVIQTCDVDIEDSEWQTADKILKDNLAKVDDKLKSDIDSLGDRLKVIDKRIGDNHGNLSEDIHKLKTEVENLKNRRTIELIVKTDNSKVKDLGKQHNQLPTLIKILSTKLNVYLVGPAGAGKTHAAIQCAEALDIPFHFTGAVASEFKLTGFMDAQGRIVSTEFRKAYENGGLFLFDEIDASYPQAVLAFNAALANDYMDFPDKRVQRHEKFYCIAAANTYGQGADRQYVGRNQLDAASLDRFVFLDWIYDENLERDLAGNEEWCSYVQKVRKVVELNKIRHVVSPRASIFGARLLAHGLDKKVVEATILWKGLDYSTRQKIIDGLKPKIEIQAKMDGRFSSQVEVNTMVKKGEQIGEVTKNSYYDKGEDYKVLSPCDGTILFIRNQGKVEKGSVISTIQDDTN